MKTDIEIAQAAELTPITEVAGRIGIEQEDLEVYGKYKAKLSEEYIERIKKNPEGRLILVTAINPTPAGEAKPRLPWDLGRLSPDSGKRRSLPCVSRLSDRASASRAARRAAGIPRSCRWRI